MPEWTKCDYILQNERPNLQFKSIMVSQVEQDSPKILEYIMSKCQYLDVSNCQFSETALKSSSSNKIYNLEALKVVSTELDISFIQN